MPTVKFMSTPDLQQIAARIEEAFEQRASLSPSSGPRDVVEAVNAAIELLDSGAARVAERVNGAWRVN